MYQENKPAKPTGSSHNLRQYSKLRQLLNPTHPTLAGKADMADQLPKVTEAGCQGSSSDLYAVNWGRYVASTNRVRLGN